MYLMSEFKLPLFTNAYDTVYNSIWHS